jgi:NADPH:quinone reductase-like Zn-dependent oxidoreductase
VKSLRPAVGRDREHLDRIAELVAKGALRAPEIKTYPLSEAEAAQRVSEGRHFRGKLILKVR